MPQLAPASLVTHLQGPLAPLYLLHGDGMLIAEAADAIRQAAHTQGYQDREVLRADDKGFSWQRLPAAAQEISLFCNRKLLEIRIPEGKVGTDGAAALLNHWRHNYPGVLTLITLPDLDWRIRRNADWFRQLQNAAVCGEFPTPTLEELPTWLGQRLARQGQNTTTQALEFIARQVEGNLWGAKQETARLALLYPPGPLTLEQVRAAVGDVAHHEEDQLREAVLGGQTARCIRLLATLRSHGAHEIFLLFTLTQILRHLIKLRMALDRRASEDELAVLRRGLFNAALYLQAARRLPIHSLHRCLQMAAQLDRINKGLSKGDAWNELQLLCLRLCR